MWTDILYYLIKVTYFLHTQKRRPNSRCGFQCQTGAHCVYYDKQRMILYNHNKGKLILNAPLHKFSQLRAFLSNIWVTLIVLQQIVPKLLQLRNSI